MRLKDWTAIVVGAGSSGPGMGNGKATALLFAREGAKVVCVDIKLEAAEETVGMIRNEGGEAMAIQADVTREEEARRIVDETVARYGKVDTVFNNVGIGGGNTGLDATEEQWDAVMNTNLKSIINVCKYAVPVMKKNGGGTIVNNSSMASYHAHYIYAYAASKAGVNALTRSMAAGLARYNIRVNCVAPGLMDTPMVARIMTERRLRMVEERVPLKRHGRAEETAYAVLFLASRESSFITGVTLPVDGGMSIL